MWTIGLTEYVYKSGVMYVINARDKACPSCYISNPWFDNLSGSILFSLPDRILDALKYFGLYNFALRISNDPIVTAVASSL